MTDQDGTPDALMDDLTAHVGYLEDRVVDLDRALETYPVEALDLGKALELRAILNTTAEGLRGIRERMDQLIGNRMGQYQVTVEGQGTVKRHRNVSRRNWQSDDLLRYVLDSRKVDPDTGEVETQIDALKAVYGLKGYHASLKALEARGIDPDEWAETQDKGWKLEVR